LSVVSGIRRLHPRDAVSLVALRREALANSPLAFEASPHDDRGLELDFVRASLADEREQAVFGYFEGESLAGMVGVARASGAKRRHKAYVWGMYVAPRARRKGAGRALLEAAVAHARAWPGLERLHLSVTSAAAEARKMYREAGFRVWGEEERALQWEGRFVDEAHLVLELDRPEGAPRKPRGRTRPEPVRKPRRPRA
jgi:ribosomal protein S18 acetylase RimI-like enzyme